MGKREEILRRIEKLKRFTPDNCTSFEYEKATEILRRLMLEYQVEESEIIGRKRIDVVERIFDYQNPIPSWMRTLFNELSRGNDCRSIVLRDSKNRLSRMGMYGFKDDVELAFGLYTTLYPIIYSQALKSGRESGHSGNELRSYVNSFGHASSGKIRARLEAINRQEMVKSDIKALVVVKTDSVSGFIHEKFPQLVTSSVSWRVNQGVRDGAAFGEKVHLGRVISKKSTKMLK